MVLSTNKLKEIDMELGRTYTYAELCRMKKSRVIRIAGFNNMKHLLKLNFNRSYSHVDAHGMPVYNYENASKKYIASIIASDR